MFEYTYQYWKDYQAKQDRQRAVDTFEAQMNTKSSLAVYEYFGCLRPIVKGQFKTYKALPIQKWNYLGHSDHRGYKMDKATHVLLVVALTVGVIVGGIYISRTVSVDCWNFFGLAKGCAASTVK